MSLDFSTPVLVVDDYQTMVRILRNLLKQVGFKDFDDASDGTAALAKLREKKYGIWQEVTWDAYAAHVRAVCLGLAELGLARGEMIAVLSGNRPAWLYVELAAQSLGAIPVGVFVDSLPEQARVILGHCEARFALAEESPVRLKVFDVRGALVRTLADGVFGPGETEVAWDGADDRGRATAGGLYFYRLEVPGRYIETRRMIRIR